MRRRLAVLATLVLIAAVVAPVPAEAASTWTARTTWTGSLGSLGATSLGISSQDRFTIRAKSLKAATIYSVTLRRGTCAKSGSLVLSKRMTTTRLGRISQMLVLTSAQTRLATLPLTVRVGSRCAPLLAPLGVTTTTVGTVSSVVPAGGGAVQIASGASVVFPPGALASDVRVSITALAPSSPSSQGSAAAWPSQPVGDLYRIDTLATALKAPLTLTLPVPASAPTATLVLAYFNPATGTWLPVLSAVDASAHAVSAQVDHFSTWGIFDLSSWLVALGGLASGDLRSFLQGTADFLTPCQPGTGLWHIDNTHANNAVEACAKSQTDQTLSLVVRNLRLYPLEIYSPGYITSTVVDAGEETPPLTLSRTNVPPATVLASMTEDTMVTAVVMSILDEISLIAPLGDSVGVKTVLVGEHKVPLSVISDLANTLKGVVDLGPIWIDLQARNFTQAGLDFTRLVDNDVVLTNLALALNKVAIATGWYALSDLGADAMKVALVALAPLLAGKVIVEMLTMDADYFFSAQNSVSVTWTRATPTPTPYAGVFTATGSMTIPRIYQTATLLPDGRVLVAGGSTDGAFTAALSTAELYDPRTGTFTATGSMTTPRFEHTATLLRDGRVLIAGGSDGRAPLGTAELYDPRTGTFTATGSMATPRNGQSAMLLQDGRVLIAGGGGAAGILASAELYDPQSGTFVPTGSMVTARFVHPATLLGDGRVLIAGGQYAIRERLEWGPTDLAELYDPRTGLFAPTTTKMVCAVSGQTDTLLADGRVLVAGTFGCLPSAELFNPKTGSFTPAQSMSAARRYHMATLLTDGRVLVAGGEYSAVLASSELYDPRTGAFSAAGAMTTPRYSATATLLGDGRVLVAGGAATLNGASLAAAELFH